MSLYAKRRCAVCNSGSTQYDIVHLQWNQPGRLRLCEDCLDDLMNADETCAYCGSYAQYGTWTTKRWDKYGSVDAQEIQRVPKYRLLCKLHFQELANQVEARARQARLTDFD